MSENPVPLHTPQQALAAMLDHYAPTRVLLVGRSDQPALAAYAECHRSVSSIAPIPHRCLTIWRTSATTRHIRRLPRASAQAQRPRAARQHPQSEYQPDGGTRRSRCMRMADYGLLCTGTAGQRTLPARRTDLDALHLRPAAIQAGSGLAQCRFWANPEMFGKYWW